MRVSVSRRLALLAATEIITVAVLLAVAVGSLLGVEANMRFVKHYLLPPVDVLNSALVENARLRLQSMREPNEAAFDAEMAAYQRSLHTLDARYRSEWIMKNNPSRDARKARDTLAAEGHEEMIEREQVAVDRFSAALRRLDAVQAEPDPKARRPRVTESLTEVQTTLRQLHKENTDYIALFQSVLIENVRELRHGLLFVGGIGVLVATLAALRVRGAIAPRIRRLAESVQRFRERGVHERLHEPGQDEIAILANALDAGFLAIAERDHERERFLGIAAHELRTPLASIVGFAQVANMNPAKPELARRALEVIERHSVRLARLVDDVFLAARARDGKLPIDPELVDLVEQVHKVIAELDVHATGRSVYVDAPPTARLLADKELLGHALWALLSFSLAVSEAGEPIRITIVIAPPRADIRVDLVVRGLVHGDLERALSPFSSLVYEGIGGARTGVGLYLCREIVRLHGGTLKLEETGPAVSIAVELPS
ncbi:MAG: HAMP domain-containing histidine kinase [Labilithrix sp.]|nr:HAMP domain-containing histidine kinase [Labilithrix sp.]